MFGTGGNDTFVNFGKDSFVDGGSDTDSIISVGTNAELKGGFGADLVFAYGSGSKIDGGYGADTIYLANDNITANAGAGNDKIYNQKIDLVQAEAINDVINATTKEAKKISMFSLEGDVSKLIYPVKVMIADLISLIEVNIDYPEYEDIEVANKEKIISDIDKINIVLKELTIQGEKAKIIKDGLKVGIFGKPNVGKSSLLNALLGEEKAIVTDIAGTTRDVVEGDIVLKGLTLHLLDTAGIRESDDVVENIGVNKAKAIIDEAELVIVVLDASKELDKQDKDILELTKDKKRIIVYNKKDLAISIPDNSVAISAKENDIDALVKAIHDAVGIDEVVFNQPSLNNARQIGLLKQAMEHLNTAKADAENDLGVDLISVSLFSAYKSVLAILGEDNEIDISKEIFSRFCVGK